jgi:ABC-2 type transport system ATP-binding protein
MTVPMLRVEGIRKVFSHTSPSANHSTDDMWVNYLLGLLGRGNGHLAARRQQTVAVDDVSLEIAPGEFFGLLGPNGAGKTTLIKMLATILRPNDGTITVNGFDTVREAAQARASLNVVAASGWFAFDMQLTLSRNLEFWGRLCGLDRANALARAHDALDIVGLGEWRDETPNHLSSGMRQRLALARGLLVRTPVFLLDEPTANVDPLIGSRIRDFLRNDLNRDLGQTMVLATHNMGEAEQLCDRVAIIDAGRVLACDRPDRLARALNGRVVEVNIPANAVEAVTRLRQAKITRQLSDSIAEDGSGRLRAVLANGVSPADLVAILPVDAITTEASATLEDVFLFYAGRALHDDDTSAAAA